MSQPSGHAKTREFAGSRVLILDSVPHGGACVVCGQDAEGWTLTRRFLDTANTQLVPVCFWCLELWDARGWLESA